MNKIKVFLVCVCLSSSYAQAETISEALTQCGQVQNSLKRLVCYDKVVNEMNRYGGLNDLMSVPAPLAPGAPQKEVPVPVENTKQENSKVDDFGLETKRAMEDIEEKIFAKVVSVVRGPYKKYTYTLDNGQVWKQTEGTKNVIEVDDPVYIERGMLGAFFLSREDVNTRIRVKRVK